MLVYNLLIALFLVICSPSDTIGGVLLMAGGGAARRHGLLLFWRGAPSFRVQ
jgi:hypothetical protein